MSAADRQKRKRTREALGLAVYAVEVDGAVLTSLEMAGFLKERDLIDREKVARALRRALVEWAAKKLASRVTEIGRGGG